MWDELPGDTAVATRRVRTFRLGELALIDVPDCTTLHCLDMRSALLAEWASSPSGLIVRIGDLQGEEVAAVRALADAGSLVQHWPGTPIGVVAPRTSLGDLLSIDPAGRFLTTGPTIPAVWEQMWTAGVASTLAIELAPTLRSVDGARSTVTVACLDWGLSKLIPQVAAVVGQLVTRSVLTGAGDLHLSLSQHRARIRVVVADDVPRSSSGSDARVPGSPMRVFADVSSRGQFDAGSRYFAWAVVEAQRHRSARRLPRVGQQDPR